MADQQSTYKVKADLVLDATKAQRQATQMQAKIQKLGRGITGTSSMASGLTRNLIAIGGAYLGINVLIQGFSSLTRGAVEYASELEKTRIGLTSVLAAVQNTDWDTAAKTSGRVFEQVRQDSIKSVATAQQLFTIYQGIVGPIVAAGHGLEKVRTITKDTVNAAGVLGVDLSQAQRDISMMARGTAGMDVKLFSMLRSTGAIAETTEEWNKSLTGAERIDKLAEALKKFSASGDKFAKSFAGTTSTFKGIRQEFTRAAFQPVMDAMAGSLFRINSILIDNQDRIQARLSRWGSDVAETLGKVFARAEDGTLMIAQRWDEVLAKAQKFADIMKVIGKMALFGVGAQLARPVVGAAVGGVGGLAGMMATGTAAGATGAAAGVAGGTAGAAGGAGAAASLVALGPVLLVAAGAAALLAAAVVTVNDAWAHFVDIFDAFSPLVGGLGSDIWSLMEMFWRLIKGPLKVIGSLVGGPLVLAILLAIVRVRLWVHSMKVVATAVMSVVDVIYDYFEPAFDHFWYMIARIAELMGVAVNQITKDYERLKRAITEGPDWGAMERLGYKDYGGAGGYDVSSMDLGGAPDGRTTTINDFRGSKIEVKQTFRDMDPDRVMVAMVKGLARQADMRIQSGMVPALGR